LKPYDNSFWEKSNGGRKREETKTPLIVDKPLRPKFAVRRGFLDKMSWWLLLLMGVITSQFSNDISPVN
jgi:hypothetical protein